MPQAAPSGQPSPRGGRPVKVIVLAESPWRGVVYTTRDGNRRVFNDPVELLRMIAELTRWPGAETALPVPETSHE